MYPYNKPYDKSYSIHTNNDNDNDNGFFILVFDLTGFNIKIFERGLWFK